MSRLLHTLPRGKSLDHFILLPPKGTDVRQLAESLHVACVAVINLVLFMLLPSKATDGRQVESSLHIACLALITLVLFRLPPIEVTGGKQPSYCMIVTHKV